MPSTPNPVFMQRAIDLATGNVRSGAGGPFAAVIVKDGVVVGEAANSVTATNDPTAHGEVNAIRKACAALGTFSLQGCEMYTSCEPCPMCLAASYWARLDAVYYGNDCDAAARAGFDDSFLYQQFKLDREDRAMPSQQLLPDDAWESFQAWQDSPNKIEY
jgi:guanine deaminase